MDIVKEMKKIITRNEIPNFLAMCKLTNRIVEVGVRDAKNFEILLKCNPVLAVGIDHWSEGTNQSEQDMGLKKDILEKMYGKVFLKYVYRQGMSFYRGRSEEAVKAFDDGYFDYGYIDADHTEGACYGDIIRWWPKVKTGGVLAGHDYINMKSPVLAIPFGVIKAVSRFREECDIGDDLFHVTKERFPSWMIFKK